MIDQGEITSRDVACAAAARPRVLVALHATHPPHGAIELGRIVAGALGAPLHGVLVWPTEIEPREVPTLLHIVPEALDGMVLDVEVGDPVERIRAATQLHKVAFVVLTCELGATSLYGLGDIGSRAFDDAETGLLVVRPGAPPPRRLERILLPLDGTPSTAAAIGPATELACDAGAALDIVLIGEATEAAFEPGSMQPPQYVDQPQHEWPAFSEEFIQRFLGSIGRCPVDVPTRFFLGVGDPASEILRFASARDADLITLVWHGGDAPHGHVFRAVFRESERPILVLRR